MKSSCLNLFHPVGIFWDNLESFEEKELQPVVVAKTGSYCKLVNASSLNHAVLAARLIRSGPPFLSKRGEKNSIKGLESQLALVRV